MAQVSSIKQRSLLMILALSAAALAAAPFFGVVNVLFPAPEAAHVAEEIFWSLRLPRILLAFACGSALGVGGLVFQSMLKNPLATPYTLGVASGAACGAVLLLVAPPGFSLLGLSGAMLGGFAGAAAATLLVYGLAAMAGALAMHTLLLSGIAMSFFFSSAIMLIQYLGDPAEVYRVVRWLMGGLETVGYRDAVTAFCLALLLIGAAARFIRELDAMATDDELAFSWGIDVARIQKLMFFAASLTIGGIVSICGPIGFIGIMLPHICRMLVGSRMLMLLPATAVSSGAFLVACDAAARTLAAPAEIPVGVITALLGGPFFVWLLLTRERQH